MQVDGRPVVVVDGGAVVVRALLDGGAVVVCALVDGWATLIFSHISLRSSTSKMCSFLLT